MMSISPLPDLATRPQIERFVDLFYADMLADEDLAPIFVEVAAIELDVHLPHIKNYWCKLLLGENNYRRHTMNIHRALHGKRELRPADFSRWLALFHHTVDAYFHGEKADRAKKVASSIAENMARSLSEGHG